MSFDKLKKIMLQHNNYENILKDNNLTALKYFSILQLLHPFLQC